MGVTAWSSDRETAQQLFLANTKENERGKEATSRHDDGDTSSHSSTSAIRNDASSELWRGCPWPSSPARSQGRGSSYPEATCCTSWRRVRTGTCSTVLLELSQTDCDGCDQCDDLLRHVLCLLLLHLRI